MKKNFHKYIAFFLVLIFLCDPTYAYAGNVNPIGLEDFREESCEDNDSEVLNTGFDYLDTELFDIDISFPPFYGKVSFFVKKCDRLKIIFSSISSQSPPRV